MELRWLAPVVLAACSGGKPKVASSDDAKAHVPAGSNEPVVARDAAPLAPGNGDLAVRVEWRDVPLEARAPKPCGADVAPTTTWGIPDAVVTVAPAPGSSVTGSGSAGSAANAAHAARVVLEHGCLAPRVQVATALAIASGELQPASLTVARDGKSIPVQLPIAGHEVTVALEPGNYELAAGSAHAWIVDPTTPSAVSDASGVATLRDLPSGVYTVSAWLPSAKRAGKAEVTVTAGALADVTVQLQPSP